MDKFNHDIYESFRILREAENNNDPKDNEDAIPYSAQDTLMTNVLASAKQEFGADFNQIKNPMLYYPSDGDITLSGVIPEMNDAKFQFRYKVGDGAGCYVWSNPYMPISDKTIQTLSKVNGVCKNWRDEISKSEDCRPSNYRDPKDVQNNTQGQGEMPEGNGEEEAAADAGAEQQPMQEGYRRGDDIPSGYYSRFNVRPGDDII
jgi:hypothetical protein